MKPIVSLTFIFLVALTSAKAQDDFRHKMRSISDDLAQQLQGSTKRRVAVANFQDLQGNVTELGRWLAERFSNGLINGKLDVIDRSQLKQLMEERNLLKDAKLDPKNVIEFGKMEGVDIVIVGTIAPLDKTVDITVKAIDVQRGTAVGASDGEIPRTDAINGLLRSTVSSGGGRGSGSDPERTLDGVDPIVALLRAKVSAMNSSQCHQKGNVYGQICFLNNFREPIVLYKTSQSSYDIDDVLFTAGGSTCSPLIFTGLKDETSRETTFYFKTVRQTSNLIGSFTCVVDACTTKAFTLDERVMFLKKK